MIERSRKSARESNKDYDALVDFPVEIVGRDGSVRRYSFEESVRLYQRRVASAATRMDSPEGARREIDHCRSRIAQLRRSYLVRYGWTAIRAADTPGLLAGDFAGEIAAFLRKAVGREELEPEELEVALLDEDEHHDLYYARHRSPAAVDAADLWRVYVFRFRERGSCLSRERFFQVIKTFQSAATDEVDAERLVAFHHTVDCGIILTTAGAPQEPPLRALDWLELGASRDDTLRAGIAALRQGSPEEALRLFIATYEAEHFRRSAYVGALVVADHVGAWDQAGATAAMAGAYFPVDPVIRWHLALCALRAGRSATAEINVLRGIVGPRPPVQLLAGIDALSRGRVREARRLIMGVAPALSAQEPDLAPVAGQLRGLMVQRDVIFALGTGIGLLGLLLGLLLGPWMLLLTVIGACTILLAQTQLHHRLRRALLRPGVRGLRLGNPVGLRVIAPRRVSAAG